MEKFPAIYETRVARALDQLRSRIYSSRAEVRVAAFEPRGEPVAPDEAFGAEYREFAVGESWGAPWNTVWFRIRGTVPAEWHDRRVAVAVAFSPSGGEGFTAEGLVWEEGKPVRALNVNRDDIPVVERAQGGEAFEFFIEAAANPGTAVIGGSFLAEPQPDGEPVYRLEKAELVCVDREAWETYHDFYACNEAMRVLPANTPRRGQLLYALNQATHLLDGKRPETFAAARAALREVMGRKNSETVHTVSAVGHAHIDTAWLWPLRETIRKCARTFSTVLRYMEEYPDYKFSCSQAQQYAWMKAYYPTIYADIQQAVARGQWEPIGSMWVEVDCNIPSGESLVRQILHGKKFFREEFGMETEDLWIPDVFGYSASTPQIMRRAGIRYFLTQKISWNQVNQFPHHTFLWEGIDGTRIFSHFPPADTYNGRMNGEEIARCVQRFKENDRATRSLYPYGFGDGGGGPTRTMLETARRWRDFEGMPRVELEKVSEFFPKAEADAKDLPVWSGELYLEFHRGTYTSQARTKRGNRKGEFLLRQAEFYDAISSAFTGERLTTGEAPPHAIHDVTARGERGAAAFLERAWKLLLLNQFHDIIPGSSIGWVYRDSARDYETIEALADAVLRSGRQALRDRIDTRGFRDPLMVFNSLSHARAEVVSDPEGHPVWVETPACGYRVLERSDALPADVAPVALEEGENGWQLENGLLRVLVNRDGLLASVFDLRAQREVLEPGKEANLLQLHRDIPNQWEAWDIDVFYGESCEELRQVDRIEVVEQTPLRVVIAVSRSWGSSTLRQHIVMRAGSARLDFETDVDWREEQKLLKVAFPVNVRASRATYEIQFGHIDRPTHRNTSWDAAQFEVCAQKWVDLSEGDYGVALLNDGKYGHDVSGNVMRLSLLRAPNAPDPAADRGRHRFTYSIFPHPGGSPVPGGVVEEGYALNVPLEVEMATARAGELPAVQSFFEMARAGLILDTVKMAEAGDAIIVRAYEAYGTRGSATLLTTLPVKSAFRADLLEQPETELEVRDQTIEFQVAPFEIVTLALYL